MAMMAVAGWCPWPRWLISRIFELSPLELRVRRAEFDCGRDAVAVCADRLGQGDDERRDSAAVLVRLDRRSTHAPAGRSRLGASADPARPLQTTTRPTRPPRITRCGRSLSRTIALPPSTIDTVLIRLLPTAVSIRRVKDVDVLSKIAEVTANAGPRALLASSSRFYVASLVMNGFRCRTVDQGSAPAV
jgi:hypothetical protein